MQTPLLMWNQDSRYKKEKYDFSNKNIYLLDIDMYAPLLVWNQDSLYLIGFVWNTVQQNL